MVELFTYLESRNRIGYKSTLATFIKEQDLYFKKVDGKRISISVAELNAIDIKRLSNLWIAKCIKSYGSVYKRYAPLREVSEEETLDNIQAFIERTLLRQYYYFSVPSETKTRKKISNVTINLVPGFVYSHRLNNIVNYPYYKQNSDSVCDITSKYAGANEIINVDLDDTSLVNLTVDEIIDAVRSKIVSDKKSSLNGTYNVYMAGKIQSNDWRHNLVKNLRDYNPYSQYLSELEKSNLKPLFINDNFIYTGPFFIGCDHSCYHGPNSHGRGASMIGNVGCDFELNEGRKQVFDRCKTNIQDSDYIFCYLESADAYGTLWEIGYAKAIGKKIFMATNKKAIRENWYDDLWFSRCSVDVDIISKDETEAFDKFIDYVSKCESESRVSTSSRGTATPAQIRYAVYLLKLKKKSISEEQIIELSSLSKSEIGKIIQIFK